MANTELVTLKTEEGARTFGLRRLQALLLSESSLSSDTFLMGHVIYIYMYVCISSLFIIPKFPLTFDPSY